MGCSPASEDARVGLTLVEIILAVAIAGIIGALSLRIIGDSLETFIYLPSQGRVSQGASEILEAIIEGSWTTLAVQPDQNPLKGLRYATQLHQALPDRVEFTNSDNVRYILWWDGTWSRLLRFLASAPGAQERIPYYAAEATMKGKLLVRGRNISGDIPDQGEVVFRYFHDESIGAATVLIPDAGGGSFNGGLPLSTASRIEVNVAVRNRQGRFEFTEGAIELSSSSALRAI